MDGAPQSSRSQDVEQGAALGAAALGRIGVRADGLTDGAQPLSVVALMGRQAGPAQRAAAAHVAQLPHSPLRQGAGAFLVLLGCAHRPPLDVSRGMVKNVLQR